MAGAETAGRPYSRATMAACDIMPPMSATAAVISGKTGPARRGDRADEDLALLHRADGLDGADDSGDALHHAKNRLVYQCSMKNLWLSTYGKTLWLRLNRSWKTARSAMFPESRTSAPSARTALRRAVVDLLRQSDFVRGLDVGTRGDVDAANPARRLDIGEHRP